MHIPFWPLIYIGLKIHKLKCICIIPFLEKQPSSFFFFNSVKFGKNKDGKFSDKDRNTETPNAFLLCAGLAPLLGVQPYDYVLLKAYLGHEIDASPHGAPVNNKAGSVSRRQQKGRAHIFSLGGAVSQSQQRISEAIFLWSKFKMWMAKDKHFFLVLIKVAQPQKYRHFGAK